jgi:purine nucleosidase
MAGSFFRGVHTEWNMRCDPHAAAIVYKAPVRLHRSIGLDVTLKVQMDREEVAQRFKHPLLEPVLDFSGHWFKHRPLMTFHDPLAAVTVFEPSVCTYRTGQVSIETRYPDLDGRTFWRDDKKGPHQAASTVDAERFFKEYFKVFGK